MSQQLKKFDFNIGQILQSWTVKDALREIIANALDEQKLSQTDNIAINFYQPQKLVIKDYGRGLHTKHLMQNENPEKYQHPALIGLFGIGLKDALATLSRYQVAVTVGSPFLKITDVKLSPKTNFADIKTLHAFIEPKGDVKCGTTFTLWGVNAQDVIQAKHYFLQFRNLSSLHENKYGQIIAKTNPSEPSSIFINGLEVNTESNFQFHYNITNKDQKIRNALNRERNNVGRSAYANRIKKIISHCETPAVKNELLEQFYNLDQGTACEEVSWIEVQRYLFKNIDPAQVVMVTQQQLLNNHNSIDLARRDGRKVIVVPEQLYKSRPDTSLDHFVQHQYQDFSYQFIETDQLTSSEVAMLGKVPIIYQVWGEGEAWVQAIPIKISNNMPGTTVGAWKEVEQMIIIKRTQLATLAFFAGTLIHEWVHAQTGYPDNNRNFETALTECIGNLMVKLIKKVPFN